MTRWREPGVQAQRGAPSKADRNAFLRGFVKTSAFGWGIVLIFAALFLGGPGWLVVLGAALIAGDVMFMMSTSRPATPAALRGPLGDLIAGRIQTVEPTQLEALRAAYVAGDVTLEVLDLAADYLFRAGIADEVMVGRSDWGAVADWELRNRGRRMSNLALVATGLAEYPVMAGPGYG